MWWYLSGIPVLEFRNRERRTSLGCRVRPVFNKIKWCEAKLLELSVGAGQVDCHGCAMCCSLERRGLRGPSWPSALASYGLCTTALGTLLPLSAQILSAKMPYRHAQETKL